MELTPELLMMLGVSTFRILAGSAEVFYLCGWDTREDRLRWVSNLVDMIEWLVIFMGPHPGYAWLRSAGRPLYLAVAEARLLGSESSLRAKISGDSTWIPPSDPLREVKSLGDIPAIKKEPNMHAFDAAHDLSLFAQELGQVELKKLFSLLVGLFEDIDELITAKILRDERRVQPRIE